MRITRAGGKVDVLTLRSGGTYFAYDWGDRLTCSVGAVALKGACDQGNVWFDLFANPSGQQRHTVLIDKGTVARLLTEYRLAHPVRAAVRPSDDLDLKSWSGASSR